jgi:hypothetical protein
VKANRESPNRRALIDARNIVSNATANLVASAKSCSQIIDDQSTYLLHKDDKIFKLLLSYSDPGF